MLGIGSNGPELHQNTSHPRDGQRAMLTRQGLQSTTADSSSGNHFTHAEITSSQVKLAGFVRYHDGGGVGLWFTVFSLPRYCCQTVRSRPCRFFMYSWPLFLRCSVGTMIQRTRTTQCKHYNCDAYASAKPDQGRVANTRKTPNVPRIFTGNASCVRCTS